MEQRTKMIGNPEVLLENLTGDTSEPQAYRRPEIADLGKASKLLQGGAYYGHDNFSQQY